MSPTKCRDTLKQFFTRARRGCISFRNVSHSSNDDSELTELNLRSSIHHILKKALSFDVESTSEQSPVNKWHSLNNERRADETQQKSGFQYIPKKKCVPKWRAKANTPE